MEFKDFFKEASSVITIFGTNPLHPHLERSAQIFADMLTLHRDLKVRILCESDSENFSQSLCLDTVHSPERVSFATLMVHRERVFGRSERGGIQAEMGEIVQQQGLEPEVLERFWIRQVNLRLPVNLILADSSMWCCITTCSRPTLDSYFQVGADSPLYRELADLVEFYTDPEKAGVFLSARGEELIQMYDRNGFPRGIFPRACFYSTDFERYSIWGFVFNRAGSLLLHQRSMTTKDGRGLWDKSIGGHVDLRDSSTSVTAKRELVEELFLPEAEFTKYVRADLGDIVHYGEWNPRKRHERALRQEMTTLNSADWVMFRATDDAGDPLVINRVSDRRIHDARGGVTTKRTVFRSDLFFFIAPPGYLDTDAQMDALVGLAEQSGAAQDHRLASPAELRDWIRNEEAKGTERETFTDDLLYVNLRLRESLENFSEFVKYLR